MLAYDPTSNASMGIGMGMGMGMGRMGEMDQMVLSPPPQSQGGMIQDGNWMAFGQVMPHTTTGTDGGGGGGGGSFGLDPFGGNNQ